MSSLGKADHHKPSRGRWNDSSELDVFEAARYFSGYNDGYALGGSASNYLMAREENQGYFRAGRTSLDLPSYKHHHHHHQYNHPKVPNHHHSHHKNHHQQQQIKEKKYKQPSSPGGKLAHFLNSLFTQAITSKKKPSKSTKKDDEDDDSPSSGRRRRRSSCSISHFRSTTTTTTSVDTKSLYSCSSFGFRSPPYNLNNPTKSFRNNNNHSFSDHHHPKKKKDDDHEKITRGSKLGHWVNGEKCKGKTGDSNKKETLKKLIKEEEEVDDGSDESDSSSDLFELQIDYGFGFCSTGLPVYETTCMDAINRSSVNNGPIQT